MIPYHALALISVIANMLMVLCIPSFLSLILWAGRGLSSERRHHSLQSRAVHGNHRVIGDEQVSEKRKSSEVCRDSEDMEEARFGLHMKRSHHFNRHI